jgi:hypothetical protein
MSLVARTMRFLANRILGDAPRSNQHIARANAAQASAILRERRHEKDDVDAYLQARRSEDA